jgi:hypothetical protein
MQVYYKILTLEQDILNMPCAIMLKSIDYKKALSIRGINWLIIIRTYWCFLSSGYSSSVPPPTL